MLDVALIGGSFNPPHVGHLLCAHYVRAIRPFDQVWLMPSYRHPFGKTLASFEDRLAMCRILCEDASGWLRATDVEREVSGDGFTVEALEHLRRTRPADQFTLVIGSDIVADLPRWRDLARIRQLARLLVILRAGYPSDEAVGPPLVQVSSSEIRERLARGESPAEVVPHRVLGYVREKRLYGASSA